MSNPRRYLQYPDGDRNMLNNLGFLQTREKIQKLLTEGSPKEVEVGAFAEGERSERDNTSILPPRP